MRSTTLAALALLGAAAVAGTVAAQEAGQARHPDREAIRAELGLSDEQATALRALRLQLRKDGIKRRADARVAWLELQQALEAPSLDEAAVAARVKALADLESAAARARAENQLAVRRLVTAEQYQKLSQMRTRLRGARERRGRHWRPPAGDGAPAAEPGAPAAPSGPA